jgi:uncharacterized membrane protein
MGLSTDWIIAISVIGGVVLLIILIILYVMNTRKKTASKKKADIEQSKKQNESDMKHEKWNRENGRPRRLSDHLN